MNIFFFAPPNMQHLVYWLLLLHSHTLILPEMTKSLALRGTDVGMLAQSSEDHSHVPKNRK